MNQAGRGSIQLPVLAPNNLPETAPVSLLIQDVSSFSGVHLRSCTYTRKSLLFVQPSAAEAGPTSAQEQHKHPDRSLEHPGSTVFDKAMGQLATIFPGYTKYIQLELCSSAQTNYFINH